MPNAVARNGADRPCSELSQSQDRMVRAFTTSVTSMGSSRVATVRANSSFLSG